MQSINDKFTPLDDYEREIKEEIDKGNFQPIENMEEEIKRYQMYAKKQTIEEIGETNKNQKIDLEEFKNDKEYNIFLNILNKEGLTYKEAFKRFIHKVAIGEVSLKMN